MQIEQLRALAAIVDHGTFDAAARSLHVTPSAISQRIKALESATGRVLLRRETPITVTEAGESVLRLARQVITLEAETWHDLGVDTTRTVLPVAVNADSLATWLSDLFPIAATWSDISLHLVADDQDKTSALLRSGEVVAALTSDPEPVAGCRSTPLGRMRYLPVAAAGLAERHRRGRGYDWDSMPMLRYNIVDQLQDHFLAERSAQARPPVAYVPDSRAFADAVHAGLGWGMLPEAHLSDDLTRLHGGHHDIALHWQSWRIQSEPMQRLAAAVQDLAKRSLRRP